MRKKIFNVNVYSKTLEKLLKLKEKKKQKCEREKHNNQCKEKKKYNANNKQFAKGIRFKCN